MLVLCFYLLCQRRSAAAATWWLHQWPKVAGGQQGHSFKRPYLYAPPPPPRQVLARIAQLAVAASLPLAVALFAARGSLPGLFTDDSLVAAEVVRGFVPPWSCACACR